MMCTMCMHGQSPSKMLECPQCKRHYCRHYLRCQECKPRQFPGGIPLVPAKEMEEANAKFRQRKF